MEKQKYSKPYIARFIWYRWWVGGTWRKYAYYVYRSKWMDGWYWTQENKDYCCDTNSQLKKFKEVTYTSKEIKERKPGLGIWASPIFIVPGSMYLFLRIIHAEINHEWIWPVWIVLSIIIWNCIYFKLVITVKSDMTVVSKSEEENK